MSSGPEKHVENGIRKYLLSIGAWDVKIFANEMQGAGYPDLLVCYRGRFIALECKAPAGKVAKIQEATLNKIRRAGGVCAKPRSVQDVKDLIKAIDQASRGTGGHLPDVPER